MRVGILFPVVIFITAILFFGMVFLLAVYAAPGA
nr:YoaK family small membrane protein [Salmonella enterica]